VEEEGTPSGREWAAKVWDEGCHLSHIQTHVQLKDLTYKGTPPLKLWAATSRVRHLSKRGALSKKHMLQSKYHIINQQPITLALSPLTISLTFVLLFCL
jgi:hypothetical protein